jgi:hypothetical protein
MVEHFGIDQAQAVAALAGGGQYAFLAIGALPRSAVREIVLGHFFLHRMSCTSDRCCDGVTGITPSSRCRLAAPEAGV